jgi:hypothetical protein
MRVELSSRVRACWRFKVLLTLLLNLFFWIGYGYLAYHRFFPLWIPPTTWVDKWVPFQPKGWSFIYLSESILTLAVPWLLTRGEELRRYAVGLAFLMGVSFLLFLFCPVASPRPPGITGEGWHGLIVTWDGPTTPFLLSMPDSSPIPCCWRDECFGLRWLDISGPPFGPGEC